MVRTHNERGANSICMCGRWNGSGNTMYTRYVNVIHLQNLTMSLTPIDSLVVFLVESRLKIIRRIEKLWGNGVK